MPDGPDDRYARQTLLPFVGEAGRGRIAGGRIVVVGCGALGTHAADLLVRAGAGRITIVDRDVVEWSNLQRQSLFDEADAGAALPKAVAAAQRLGRINSEVTVEPIVAHVGPSNVEAIVGGPRPADAIVDGTDNFPTRLLLNDAAVKLGIPLVYGGVVGSEGTQATILPRGGVWEGPGGGGATVCLRCLLPEAPPPGSIPTCDTAGVLGSAAAIVAAAQATDAIKILLGRFDAVSRTLLRFDAWSNERIRVSIAATPGGPSAECPCCQGRRFDYLTGEAGDSAAALCGRDAVQVWPAASPSAGVDLRVLAASWRGGGGRGGVVETPYFVRASIGESPRLEVTVFADGRAIVRGTSDPGRARSAVSRLLGG